MGGPHYYITYYYYYRRAIVFFCDTAGLWRRGGAVSSNMGAMPTSGICVCHYSRAVVSAAAALLLQIVPIGTYTMSYYLTARAKVSSVCGWWQQAAGGRRQILLWISPATWRESPDVMTRFEELTHQVKECCASKKRS